MSQRTLKINVLATSAGWIAWTTGDHMYYFDSVYTAVGWWTMNMMTCVREDPIVKLVVWEKVQI